MSNSKQINILVIEDNVTVAQNIDDFFTPQGYVLDFAHTGTQGLSLALENYYDVIILDLMLPGMDGIEVCQKIRQNTERHIPIVMLTARDSLDDKLTGFDIGADDYLTKPFALEELHARCLVLANRQKTVAPSTITLGQLTIDTLRQEVVREGKPLNLQRIPFKILLILAQSHPRIVSRSELWSRIWGDSMTNSDVIRSHVYQLRQALDKPFEHTMLATVHGVGFNLKVDESA